MQPGDWWTAAGVLIASIALAVAIWAAVSGHRSANAAKTSARAAELSADAATRSARADEELVNLTRSEASRSDVSFKITPVGAGVGRYHLTNVATRDSAYNVRILQNRRIFEQVTRDELAPGASVEFLAGQGMGESEERLELLWQENPSPTSPDIRFTTDLPG